MGWVTIPPDQWGADVQPKYEMELHAPVKLYKGLPWPVCKRCGLVYLKNSFTRWCVAKGCLAEYHPGFKQAMKGK